MKIDGIPVIDPEMPIPVDAVEPLEQGFAEAGGIKIKWVTLRKGERVLQHIHPHAHATFVLDGVVELTVDGKDAGLFFAMEAIDVKAGAKHEILATTPAKIACIHYLPEE